MFLKHVQKFIPLMETPGDGSGGGGNENGELSGLDDLDILDEGSEEDSEGEEGNEDKGDEGNDNEDGEDDGEEESDGEGEDEEDGEEDEEGDEEEESEPEVDINTGKITVKGLKEQYPDIFKKNPGLKDVIFREREYSKVFGSIDDAQEASKKSETLDNFEQSLMAGDIGSLIDTIADANENSAVKIAENFLPALFERSRPLFAKITLPVIKGMIRNTFQRAENRGDKQLSLACQYLSRDLFDEKDVLKATEHEESRGETAEEKRIREEREGLRSERVNTARTDILNQVTKSLNRDIKSRLGDKVSDFVRDALSEKIIKELNSTLSKDQAHMSHMSSLWKKMERGGFSAEAKSKIISASLARAKAVLPSVVARVKAQGKSTNREGKKVVKGKEGKQIPSQGRQNNNRNRQPDKIGRGESDFEFLSR